MYSSTLADQFILLKEPLFQESHFWCWVSDHLGDSCGVAWLVSEVLGERSPGCRGKGVIRGCRLRAFRKIK